MQRNRSSRPTPPRNQFVYGKSCGLAAALLLACGGVARAQSIDYGSLESMFGEPVTTSVTGSPQRASEAPASLIIVTNDEIRRSGARDIPGILRHVPGVDVMQWTNDKSDVSIRGYNQAFSPRLLVLIDGRQVYADHYGYIPWTALPVELSAIRQIEVVEGPNTALFGFNAVSGVINIVTYNPLYDDVNSASIGGGTQGLIQGSLVKTFKAGDKGGLRFSMGGRKNDDFSTPVPAAAGALPRKPDDRFAFDLDGVLRLSDHMQLSLAASHAGAASNVMDPTYSLSNDQQFTSSVKGKLSAETHLGLLQATVYKNWTTQHIFVSPLNHPLYFRNSVTVVQLQDIFKLGSRHTFRAGAEYRHNTVETTPFTGARVFYDVFSGSAMWNWTPTPALSLTNAVRFDQLGLGRSGLSPPGYPFTNADWDHTLRGFSFNTGAVWKVGDLDTLRFLVGRGIQLPNLSELGAGLFSSPSFNSTGVPTVNPTILTSYEIDWDHALTSIGGRLRAVLFYEHGTDFTSNLGGVIPGSGPPPFASAINIGSSTGHGLELSLTGTFRKDWRWGASYRYEAIDDHFTSVAQGGADFVDFEHVTPQHMVKANLGWSRKKWEVDGYLYYQSATEGLVALPGLAGSALAPVHDYVSMDGRIAYKLSNWATLSLSGQNLLPSSQKQTLGPEVERSVYITITADF